MDESVDAKAEKIPQIFCFARFILAITYNFGFYSYKNHHRNEARI